MNENTTPIPAVLDDAKREIWEGDLVILRNKKGRAVRAMKASRWDDAVFCVEVRKYRGVAAVPLEQLAARHPGDIDVYEVNPQERWPDYDRQGATRFLKSVVFSGEDCRAAFVKTLWNLFLKLFDPSRERRTPMPCGAEAIRMADRLGGGVEPAPGLENTRMTPSDLEASPLYRYRFTLK